MILRSVMWMGILSLVLCFVRADTEIRNFNLPLPTHPPYTLPTSTNFQHVRTGIQTLNVSSYAPEGWLVWTPGPDEKWTSWTARISWAGSVRPFPS